MARPGSAPRAVGSSTSFRNLRRVNFFINGIHRDSLRVGKRLSDCNRDQSGSNCEVGQVRMPTPRPVSSRVVHGAATESIVELLGPWAVRVEVGADRRSLHNGARRECGWRLESHHLPQPVRGKKRMFRLLTAVSLLSYSALLAAEPPPEVQPLLTKPGKVIFSEDFSAVPHERDK